ncbi:MAG TPA: ABC transporter ATP-binding protein [Gaiellaceae bacterium]|nr:ABC transporter ATP-binding protein [Gaiellaceae bacterium]
MLEINDLRVAYGRTPALKGVSLTVSRGEIVALVGPNGAGKTTMLAAIFGLVKPSAGAIRLEGKPLLGLSPERVVRLGLSLVPEGRHIFNSLTVAENLAMGATARRDRREVRVDTSRMLERFPILAQYRNSPAGRLSGGEQQQLAIARALLARPRLLLLDEPSLGLAPLVIDLVFDVLAELRESGVTILLVEQNAARAIELADRSYVLRTGEVALEGERAELSTTENLEAAYLGL